MAIGKKKSTATKSRSKATTPARKPAGKFSDLTDQQLQDEASAARSRGDVDAAKAFDDEHGRRNKVDPNPEG